MSSSTATGRQPANRSLCLLVLLWAVGSSAPIPGQEESPRISRKERAQAAAQGIQLWVQDFSRGRIDPKDTVVLRRRSQRAYIHHGVEAGVLRAKKPQATTHFTLLQRLVTRVEGFHSPEIADALLSLAAAAYTGDMYSPRAMMVRDLGHFALVRHGDPITWQRVLSVALGKDAGVEVPAVAVVPVAGDPISAEREAELEESARVLRRVAALRLLGRKGESVFRIALERCLDDPDPRVRLAAAEAIGELRAIGSVSKITDRIASEPHPMVVMAMLAAVESTLHSHRLRVPISQAMAVSRRLLPVLGQKGWRNDMAIIRLLRRYPVPEAVPGLIHTLRGAQAHLDPILEIIHEKACPILADEAFQALRQMVGAPIGPDPNRWQEFWEREKDNLHIVAPYRGRRKAAGGTRGAFFGIPVVGREVVFVLDTSGSMKAPARVGTRVVDKKQRKVAVPSRLDAAVEQTLGAVQGIPAGTRFHLVSFASDVRVWNRKPIKAGRESFRRATQSLEQLQASGGTNVYAALMHALGASQLRFGQEIKRGVEEVFLLSDGQPSTGDVSNEDEILRVVREVNRYQKIRIHTVFTGSGKGADFMRKLAGQNFGVFVQK